MTIDYSPSFLSELVEREITRARDFPQVFAFVSYRDPVYFVVAAIEGSLLSRITIIKLPSNFIATDFLRRVVILSEPYGTSSRDGSI